MGGVARVFWGSSIRASSSSSSELASAWVASTSMRRWRGRRGPSVLVWEKAEPYFAWELEVGRRGISRLGSVKDFRETRRLSKVLVVSGEKGISYGSSMAISRGGVGERCGVLFASALTACAGAGGFCGGSGLEDLCFLFCLVGVCP